jgi:hypothetical protein
VLDRAAWRPLRTSAQRGGRRDGQRGHCGRWEEEQRDAWSGAHRSAELQGGTQGRAQVAACSRGEAGEEEREVEEED